MSDARVPYQSIGRMNSFPFGEEQCIVVNKISDGTAKVGYACKIIAGDPNTVGLATVGVEYGVVAAGDGLALGDTPAAGTKVRVIVHGPCVARVNAGATNVVGGSKTFCAHDDEGHFIPAVATGGAATSSSAVLIDSRAGSSATWAIILFRGISYNQNTHPG